MAWKTNENETEWAHNDYTIRLGDNHNGARRPGNMDDVFHCYHDGKYIAQRNTLDDAKRACSEHESDRKKSND